MASGFAPEFLILIGIDVFLGASILTVLLDRQFPGALPYVLDGAALIGFGELMAGPAFLASFSVGLQFYYSFTYALISFLALFAITLYLIFIRRRPFESAVLGICGTIPAGLGLLYFTSAFVNGVTLSLPPVPPVPIQGVYAMFALSVGLVVFALVVFGKKARSGPREEPAPEGEREAPVQASSTPRGRLQDRESGPPRPLGPADALAAPRASGRTLSRSFRELSVNRALRAVLDSMKTAGGKGASGL